MSRIIAIFVGLTAGYRGGTTDRALMSINDSFVVMPVLPILILLSFLLRGKMSLVHAGRHAGPIRLAVGCAADPRRRS